jgi:hypothetical protein
MPGRFKSAGFATLIQPGVDFTFVPTQRRTNSNRRRPLTTDAPRPQTSDTDREAVSDLLDGQESRRGSG